MSAQFILSPSYVDQGISNQEGKRARNFHFKTGFHNSRIYKTNSTDIFYDKLPTRPGRAQVKYLDISFGFPKNFTWI